MKDKDVMQKRYAFQKTIEFHKKIQANKPNAIFQSSVKRPFENNRPSFDVNTEANGMASRETNYLSSVDGPGTAGTAERGSKRVNKHATGGSNTFGGFDENTDSVLGSEKMNRVG